MLYSFEMRFEAKCLTSMNSHTHCSEEISLVSKSFSNRLLRTSTVHPHPLASFLIWYSAVAEKSRFCYPWFFPSFLPEITCPLSVHSLQQNVYLDNFCLAQYFEWPFGSPCNQSIPFRPGSIIQTHTWSLRHLWPPNLLF